MIKVVLNSQFVLDGIDPSSEFSLTFQEASFETITQRGSTFSNLIEFAKTAENVRFFGPLDDVNFRGASPYRLYDCDVYDSDLLVFSGVFKLIETNHTFKGRVFGASAGLFDLLKGVKLSDVDLSAFNHVYSAANVNNRRQNTTGYVYPNINYGQWTGQTHPGSGVDFTDFYPAVYIDDILEAACADVGYTFTKLNSDRVIPFSNQEFEQNKSLVVRLITTGDVTYNLTPGNSNQGINFAISSDPLDVSDASIATLGRTMILNRGTYNIQGSVEYSNVGSDIVMELYDNSTGTVYQSANIASGESGSFDFDLEVTNELTGSRVLLVRVLRVVANSDVTISAGSTFNLLSGNRQILSGDTVPIADTLPNIDVVDLFKYMAIAENALMITSNKNKTFQFVKFDTIAGRFGQSVNWAEKIVNEDEVRLLYHLDDYAQSNFLDYEVQPDADPSKNVSQIGRGTITVDDTTLEASKSLYTAPFCRTAIFEGFSNKGPMPYIPRYSDTSIDWRLPDVDPSPRVMKSVIDSSLDIRVTGTTAPGTQCNPVFEGFNIDVTNNYQSFIDTLNRLKVIEIEVQLSNFDIEFFDVTRPVFILNAYWFVLKIEQFRVGGYAPTKVKLLRLY